MAGHDGQITQQPPTQQGFAQRIENSLGMLGFIEFLLHPSKPSFEHFNGTYPNGIRDNLSSIVEMAKFFGYEIDFEANISDTINEMDADDFFDILYKASADNPDTADIDEGIQITLPSFTRLMNHAGVKEAFLSVTQSVVGTDPQLNALLSMQEINVDLSSLQHDGRALSDMTLSELDTATITGAVNGMSPDDIKGLLSSLPTDGELSQQTVVEMINASLTENGYDLVLDEGMGANEAIEVAITHLDETGFTGFFKDQEWAEGKVFDGIRAGLIETMTETITASKTSLEDGSYLASLSDEDLYNMFVAQLNTPEGRSNIKAAMADPENLDLIRTNLATMDLETLMQALPNGQALMDEKMSQKIWDSVRGFLDQNGLFQTVSGLWNGLKQFLGQFLEALGMDTLAEKLNSQFDIAGVIKPESPLMQQYQRAAEPAATTQLPPPDADPAATNDAAPVVQPGGN